MSCDRISSPDISFPLNSRDSECEKGRDDLAVSIREIRTELDKNRTFRYDARLVIYNLLFWTCLARYLSSIAVQIMNCP